MVEALHWDEQPQSFGEEIANSINRGVGLVGALAAFPILIVAALDRGACVTLSRTCGMRLSVRIRRSLEAAAECGRACRV